METERNDGAPAEAEESERGMSRREMLMTGLGAAAGVVGAAVLPQTAAATDGETMLVGHTYTSTSDTTVMVVDAVHTGLRGAVYYPGGTGVQGVNFASGCTAVSAVDAGLTGTALDVVGVAKFLRSGKASIAAGRASATVSVPGGVSTSALVLVTLQNAPGSGVHLLYAQRSGPATFKVVLDKNAVNKTYFSWMVLN